MALFSKKKKDDAPANIGAPANVSTDGGANDFSDFSDAAINSADADVAAPAKKRTLGRSGGSTKPVKAGKKALKGGSAVGLNIGNESIKVVELKGKGSDIAITAMGSMPTPPESISNGVIMSPGALTGAINDLFKQSGVKTKRVITSVSGTGSLIVRVIEVPRMDDKELSDNLQQDIDRYIPFPPSEVIMDHRALRELPTDPDAANMEVLLAAAQREVVDLHVRVLEDSKLDPQAIDVEPLAAARALTYNPESGTDTSADYSDVSALVNIGATGTEISVLRGDVLVFTRTVPTGGNQITQALADTLGLAFPDAESLKLEMGDALPANTGGYSSAMYGTTPYGNAEIFGGYTGTEGTIQAPVQTATAVQTAPAPPPAPATPAAASPSQTPPTQDDWSEFGQEEPTQASTQTAQPAEEVSNADPFDLDFFNQGPQDEPQEQNKQKDDPNAPNNNSDFDLSAFGLDPNLGNIPGEAHIYDEPEEGLDEAQLPAISDEGAWSNTPTMPTEAAAQGAPAPAEASFDFSLQDAENAPAPTGQIFQFDAGEDPSLPFPGLPAIADETPEYGAESDEYSALPAMSEEEAVTTSAPLEYDFATPEDFEPAPPQFTPSGEGEYDFNYVGEEDDAFGALPTIGDAAVTSTGSAYDYSDFDTADASGSVAGGSIVDDFDLDAITGPEVGVGTSDISAADIDAGVIGAGAAVTGAGLAAGAASSANDFDSGFGDDDFGAGFNDFGAGLGTDAGGITPQTVHGIVRPLLDELVGEVRRSLEYYASRYPDTVVRRITLVGGGARLSNLDALFTQSMGIPTTVGNPVSRLPLRAPALPPGYAEQHGPMYAVALGLALRDLA